MGANQSSKISPSHKLVLYRLDSLTVKFGFLLNRPDYRRFVFRMSLTSLFKTVNDPDFKSNWKKTLLKLTNDMMAFHTDLLSLIYLLKIESSLVELKKNRIFIEVFDLCMKQRPCFHRSPFFVLSPASWSERQVNMFFNSLELYIKKLDISSFHTGNEMFNVVIFDNQFRSSHLEFPLDQSVVLCEQGTLYLMLKCTIECVYNHTFKKQFGVPYFFLKETISREFKDMLVVYGTKASSSFSDHQLTLWAKGQLRLLE
jgi:hypothetical protein